MKKSTKRMLKLSLKLMYITCLLLLGYKVYLKAPSTEWEYLVGCGIGFVIVKLNTVPRKVTKYIITHTQSKPRRRKSKTLS